jgi:hypothetical protein
MPLGEMVKLHSLEQPRVVPRDDVEKADTSGRLAYLALLVRRFKKIISSFYIDAMVVAVAEPPRKRARANSNDSIEPRDDNESNTVVPIFKKPSNRLFAPFRALGLITNHVPFVLQLRSFKGATDGPKIHILTCLGRSWALWEGGKMGLLFVGAYFSL